MVTINTKIKERITKGLRKFQPVLRKAQASDLNESDTVTIITDMLCEIFGYDKYENITSEFAIKKTYCDIAVKLQDRLLFLIECKAIGIDLKEDYVRQATNYAANSGIAWVVLTNGITWKVYHMNFGTAVDKELVYEFDVTELSAKKQGDLELLYYLCIESFSKNSKATLDSFRAEKQILNRFIIGRVILSEAGLDGIRKCLRRLYPDLKVSNEQLFEIVNNECFRREIIEGDYADDARKAIAKQERKISKAKTKKEAAVE
ncbi:MAG: type I restriction enzyme HsdR N-terminal domain-containing protein [Clostridia bacterium]|nr:type I restriction enzyme HsdR N-terminal domain-containing protein [Clostridia bacterium]